MLQAMNTGHDGSLTTVHASSPADAVRRIETMALMAGLDLPHVAVREQVAAAVDVIVHLVREGDGSRRVRFVDGRGRERPPGDARRPPAGGARGAQMPYLRLLSIATGRLARRRGERAGAAQLALVVEILAAHVRAGRSLRQALADAPPDLPEPAAGRVAAAAADAALGTPAADALAALGDEPRRRLPGGGRAAAHPVGRRPGAAARAHGRAVARTRRPAACGRGGDGAGARHRPDRHRDAGPRRGRAVRGGSLRIRPAGALAAGVARAARLGRAGGARPRCSSCASRRSTRDRAAAAGGRRHGILGRPQRGRPRPDPQSAGGRRRGRAPRWGCSARSDGARRPCWRAGSRGSHGDGRPRLPAPCPRASTRRRCAPGP